MVDLEHINRFIRYEEKLKELGQQDEEHRGFLKFLYE